MKADGPASFLASLAMLLVLGVGFYGLIYIVAGVL